MFCTWVYICRQVCCCQVSEPTAPAVPDLPPAPEASADQDTIPADSRLYNLIFHICCRPLEVIKCLLEHPRSCHPLIPYVLEPLQRRQLLFNWLPKRHVIHSVRESTYSVWSFPLHLLKPLVYVTCRLRCRVWWILRRRSHRSCMNKSRNLR